ncbi:type I 3-dehydroquinate dehydratase [Levilactobacillus acidifarinae]|uniref:3-dehydroquinate dehydratase n=1 Tax=Levilactobacillus acidifarinae DSM 19394 = JCM 15949 TaxID=1423715 RepID=A0A0R1LJU6_9LACO|nr:type I 3-dehydroquinate dehydratase [Levilactobacillus acidifarinae]KRK95832.1 3-dehydroquinate dehydratase [Levilactobacillus acidifarinae DSM 19394]GEO69131.1 3-dehydroquinate dehydratase [Levilactobacillus acidifarinae]
MQATSVKLRNIELGTGRPKLAVPVTGKTEQAILDQAKAVKAAQPDVVEWRIDYFEGVTDAAKLTAMGQKLRTALGDLALLTTFRTAGEGGELALSDADYFGICQTVVDGGFTDALDVERYHAEDAVRQAVNAAHAQNVVVIMSNHDFDKTPAQTDIIRRLSEMVAVGADVAKIAVMPHTTEDVLTLLTATNQARQTLSQPLITMAMGDLGKVSRLAGEVFGSSLTFATVGAASAPGQISLDHLKGELDDLKLN